MVVKPMTITGGTVTNGGTGTAATEKLNTDYRNLTITALITKTSGTVGGTVTLQASLDNANWFSFTSPAAITATDVATQVVNFNTTDKVYPYYRISYTGTGTMVAVLSNATFAIAE